MIDPGIFKFFKKIITAVVFTQLPRTLTWISRKIIFPTRDIETRTRDISLMNTAIYWLSRDYLWQIPRATSINQL